MTRLHGGDREPIEMDAEETTTLFQIPITAAELAFYRTPTTQAATEPLNCATVTALFLGLLTPKEAERLSAQAQTELITSGVGDFYKWAPEISRLQDESGSITGTLRVQSTSSEFPGLFPGHGTIALKLRGQGVGHYFVVARDARGVLGVIDPQFRLYTTNILAYLQKYELYGPGDFYYLSYDSPRTEAQVAAMAKRVYNARACRIRQGGKTRRRKPTASSLPSAPTRSGLSAGGRRLRSGRRTRAYSKRTVGY